MSHAVEKSLWICGAALAGLLVLLAAILFRLGGRVPALRPLSGTTNAVAADWLTFDQAGPWFEVAELTRLTAQTNARNPFFTRHFQPPPPPSTKRVELTYLGFLEGSGAARRAFIEIGDATRALANGAIVVADHGIQEIARRTLVLTNPAGVTNVLEFRIKKSLEIPAQ
jgi:hypothetical protein